MATDRFHLCPQCEGKFWVETLFDSLLAVAAGKPHACPRCGAASPLHLSFAYALDATGGKCVVLDAFLPSEPVKWTDRDGREVIFYPFLVITEGEDGRGAWLPYWHVVRGTDGETKKYGQWAPSMDLSTFEELIEKARAKGYLA